MLLINEVRSYTFEEFREIQNKRNIDFISNKEISLIEAMIDHIKQNKRLYLKLVLVTVSILNSSTIIASANSLESLDTAGNMIIGMFLTVAKWGCIGVGLKNMITTMISGGSVKHAMNEGIMYWAGYLFIQFYPQIYDLFSGIKLN